MRRVRGDDARAGAFVTRAQFVESADAALATYHKEQASADALDGMVDALEELHAAAEPAHRAATKAALKGVRELRRLQDAAAANAFDRARRAALRESS